MLSSCVRPSVCPSLTSRYCETTGQSRCFWHAGFLPPIRHSHLVRKFGYLQKSGYFCLWDFVPNSGLRKFRHGKSTALSTKLIVVVDGRVCWQQRHDSRPVVAVYCKSVNCNPLAPLLRAVADLSHNSFLQPTRLSDDTARRAGPSAARDNFVTV